MPCATPEAYGCCHVSAHQGAAGPLEEEFACHRGIGGGADGRRRERDLYRDRPEMNKSDLIETLHQNGGLDRQTAEFVVTEVFQAMTETLIRGKRIELRGFGYLYV